MAGKVKLSRTAVFITLAVAAAVLGCIMIYVQLGVNRSLREEAAVEQQLLAQAQARLARYEELRDQAAAYRQRLADLQRMIPGSPGEDALIRDIYHLADDAGLSVAEIRFGTRAEEEEFIEMPLVVTLDGGYQGLLKTLSSLRNGTRAIRVDDIRVSGRPDGSAGVRIVISANAFYLETAQQ